LSLLFVAGILSSITALPSVDPITNEIARDLVDIFHDTVQLLPKIDDELAADKAVARTASAPVTIPASLVTEFRRHVLFSGATTCDDLSKWDCTACASPLIKSTVLYRQITKKSAAVHCYVAVNDDIKAIVVAFRGSGDATAWLQDLKFFKKSFDVAGRDAKVHIGFHNVWKGATDDVSKAVDELLAKYSGYTINVTGHSLGAAAASLIGLDLARQHPKVAVNVFGISQPRVGNAAYAAAVEKQENLKAYHLAQANDIAAKYPPRWFGYLHHATEYWIPEAFTDTIVRCDSPSGEESSECANSVSGGWNGDLHNHVLGYQFVAGCDTSAKQKVLKKQ